MYFKPIASCIAAIIFTTMLPGTMLFANPSNKENANQKPLAFIENAGQIVDQHRNPRTDIDLKLSSNGATLFVGAGQLHYQWYKSNKPVPTKEELRKQTNAQRNADTTHRQVEIYRMDVALVGANAQAKPVKEELQGYHENYYLPQCPDGVTAHTYTRVTYKDIYPGIDWVLYSKEGKVKYDFIVHAGADAGNIKLRYTGATNLQIKEGALLAETPFGTVEEAAPYSYEAANGGVVSSQYVLSGNTLQIKLGAHEGDIVIDPELIWGTYYGDFTGGIGAGNDGFNDIAADTSGKVAAVGITSSLNNIVTAGTQQTTLVGIYDGLLVLFDISGQPIWGTYYGGTEDEYLYAITTDANGQIFVAGTATSSGLGTSGTQQPAYSGTPVGLPLEVDGILAKFDPSNGLRSWATYLGVYDQVDYIMDIACDAAGDVYAVGNTSSTTGIATTGAFLTTHPGANDAGFIVHYSGNTGTRIWGSYFPGNTYNIVIDKFDRLYIAGETSYTAGVATIGAFLTTSPATAGGYAGFFSRFTTTGNRVWGSYAPDPDNSYLRLTCDNAGYLYISGYTTLAAGIATSGTHKTTITPGLNTDIYLWKFSATGSRIWGTYYGGENNETANSLTTDAAGNIYLFGRTSSTTGIATPDGIKTSITTPGWDIPYFITEISTNGQLKYGTYLGEYEYGGSGWGGSGWGGGGWGGAGWGGGSGGGWGWGINGISYGKGYIYTGGSTATTTGFATPGAYQTAPLGADGFLLQFSVDTNVYIKQPFTDTGLCKGQTLALNYGVTHPFRSGNVFTAQLSNASGSFASPTNIGTVMATDEGSISCTIPTTVATGTGYRIRIVASLPADTSYDNQNNIKIGPSLPTGVAASSNSPVCSPTSNLVLAGTSTTPGVNYYWHGPNSYFATGQSVSYANPPLTASGDYILSVSNSGCTVKDTITVLIKETPAQPTAGSNSPVCEGAALDLTSNSTTPGVTYEWDGPAGYSSTLQNPTIDPTTMVNAGTYNVVAKLNGCTSTAGSTVVAITRVTYVGIYASPNDTLCEGSPVTFVAVPVNGGSAPQYQWYKNNAPIPGETNITYITSSYATNDTFYCEMKVTGICITQLTLFSNKIGMTVMPIVNNVEASISSVPSPAQPGQPVTFTASVVNGGALPMYKWQRNGVDVGVATQNWSTNNLAPYDKITCIVTSSDPCANPKIDTSAPIEVNFPTNVENTTSTGAVHIYPNPTTNKLYIEGVSLNTTIRLFDVVGREVLLQKASAALCIIDLNDLVPGNYIIQLTGSDGRRYMQKVTKTSGY